MTRPNLFDGSWSDSFVLDPGNQSWRDQSIRYAAGDRLYVREAFGVASIFTDVVEVRYQASERASHTEFVERVPLDRAAGAKITWPAYKPSIHMPRWASRLTLIVEGVKVERLNDCSEADALAEGIEQHGRFFGLPDADWDDAELSAVAAYRRLWNSLHGADAWDANPWVVAVAFRVVQQNIDNIEDAS